MTRRWRCLRSISSWRSNLIARTRVFRLLKGYRNVPPAKAEDIALTLVKLAQLAADVPEIRELDINPLLADETGVLALDARIAVAPLDPPTETRGQLWPLRRAAVPERMGAAARTRRREQGFRAADTSGR